MYPCQQRAFGVQWGQITIRVCWKLSDPDLLTLNHDSLFPTTISLFHSVIVIVHPEPRNRGASVLSHSGVLFPAMNCRFVLVWRSHESRAFGWVAETGDEADPIVAEYP